MFKPEVGEVIQGKVVSQNERGVFVQIGTVAAFIPAEKLMQPFF